MNAKNGILFAIAVLAINIGTLTTLTATTTSCATSCDEWYYGYGDTQPFDSYSVGKIYTTKAGISYDPSGQNINPDLIDQQVNEVESCMKQAFPTGHLSDNDYSSAYCFHSNDFRLPIDRSSFVVKVASDWHYNCDHTQELLSTHADDAGCIAKGEMPTTECGCYWRAGIKCPNILITTPAFYLFKDVLIRYITSCADVWYDAKMAACASPTTDPLSLGTVVK